MDVLEVQDEFQDIFAPVKDLPADAGDLVGVHELPVFQGVQIHKFGDPAHLFPGSGIPLAVDDLVHGGAVQVAVAGETADVDVSGFDQQRE